jgi:hypothetical protein
MDWSLLRDMDTKLKNIILDKIRNDVYNSIRNIDYCKKTRKDASLFGFSKNDNEEKIIKEAKKVLETAISMGLIKRYDYDISNYDYFPPTLRIRIEVSYKGPCWHLEIPLGGLYGY